LCPWWQSVLGLSDWYIKVRVKRKYDLPPDSQGTCNWTYSRMEAAVKILHPNDYDPGFLVPQDMELTLVHELVHIRHAPFQPADDNLHHEQAVEAIAKALVALKRNFQKT